MKAGARTLACGRRTLTSILRNRRLEYRDSSSRARGNPPAVLRCRRRSSGTRSKKRRVSNISVPSA